MNQLQTAGYTFITLRDMYKVLDSEEREFPKKLVVITFDDGYLSNYKKAYPILEERQAKATISIIGAAIGRQDLEEYENYRPHLDEEAMKEIYASGIIDIQNHTYGLHSLEGKSIYERNSVGKGLLPKDNEKFDDTNDEYVLKAKNIGIVNGTGENIFQPDERISRQEVAVMFMRTLDKGFIDYDKPQYIVNDIERSFSKSDLGPGGKIITELHRIGIEFFEDSDEIFDWSYHSVEDLYVLGIMNGINNQDFGPNDQLSKEMAFVIFNRIIEKFKDEKPTFIPIEQKDLEEMSLLDLRIRIGWDYYTVRAVFDDFYSPKFSDITYINALGNPAIKLTRLENKDIYKSYETKMELISLVNQIQKPDEEVHTIIFQYNIYEDEYCHAVIGSNGETRDKLNPIFTPEDVHFMWVNSDDIFEDDAIHFIDKTRELDDEDRFEFYHRFEVLDYLIKIGNDYYPLRKIIKTANEMVSYSTEPWIEDMNKFSEEEFKKNLIDEFKTENVTEIINYDTFLSPGLYIKSDSLYHPVTKEKVTAENIPSGMAFDYEAYSKNN